MKATIQIPDLLFRKAKAKAAERGQTLREFVGEALQEKLAAKASKVRLGEPEWMQGFGKLRRLREETARIQARIDRDFEVIETEDRG
jgi:hypothetical protein